MQRMAGFPLTVTSCCWSGGGLPASNSGHSRRSPAESPARSKPSIFSRFAAAISISSTVAFSVPPVLLNIRRSVKRSRPPSALAGIVTLCAAAEHSGTTLRPSSAPFFSVRRMTVITASLGLAASPRSVSVNPAASAPRRFRISRQSSE